jgi:hypothetical protein
MGWRSADNGPNLTLSSLSHREVDPPEVTLPCRLVMTVTDVDPDYVRLDISIADGDFAGRVDVYEDPALPKTLAEALRGFPRSPADRREIVLGSFDPRVAGGGLRLIFRCIDRSGHAIVEAELEDQPMDGTAPRSVQLQMPVDAPAIDTFVAELHTWSPQRGDRRLLAGA